MRLFLEIICNILKIIQITNVIYRKYYNIYYEKLFSLPLQYKQEQITKLNI